MKFENGFIISLLIALFFTLIGNFAFAQTPDPTEEPTVRITPTEEPLPEFPDSPPELPDQLPENPLDLLPYFQALILFGAGLVAKYLTDIIKTVPGLGENTEVSKALTRLVAVAAAFVVSVGIVYLTDLGIFLADSGLWAVFLAVLGTQFLGHRGEKLLRQVGARLLNERAVIG